MPTSLGVDFLGEPETLEKQGIKIRHRNSLRNAPSIFHKFARPKQKKIHLKSAQQSVGIKKLTPEDVFSTN